MGRQAEFENLIPRDEDETRRLMRELFARLAAPLLNHRNLFVTFEVSEVVLKEAGSNNLMSLHIEDVIAQGGVDGLVKHVFTTQWVGRAYILGCKVDDG